MTLQTRVQVRGFVLNEVAERRIQRQLRSLGRRLTASPDPVAVLILDWHPDQRQVNARMRVRLGHLGGHLVSRTSGTTDYAARLAIEDIKRQIERHTARRRGEPYAAGTPTEPATDEVGLDDEAPTS